MSLLTVGTVAFDDIETPLGKASKVVGGAATYISLAASYFVDEINLVSVIGDDFPEEELVFLKSKGVNLDGLQIRQGGKILFLGRQVPPGFKQPRYARHPTQRTGRF